MVVVEHGISMLNRVTLMAACALAVCVVACSSSRSKTPVFNKPNDPAAIREMLKVKADVARQEGTAVAILLDTTGSMKDPVPGLDRQPKPKIEVAKRALLDLLEKFSAFARKNPDKKLLVGIYEFSSRKGLPSCRPVVKLGPPDLAAARSGINSVVPDGTTPIGDAMIAAKRDLDATGLSSRHLLVITDGENTIGYMPGDVAKVIAEEPKADQASIYFIAFDVGAELFDAVKAAGGLVMSADSETQLAQTLDAVLTGKILVQPPAVPALLHPSVGARR